MYCTTLLFQCIRCTVYTHERREYYAGGAGGGGGEWVPHPATCLVCKDIKSVHSKIPELGSVVHKGRHAFSSICFPDNKCSTAEEAKRPESLTSHSSHGPKQNARADV